MFHPEISFQKMKFKIELISIKRFYIFVVFVEIFAYFFSSDFLVRFIREEKVAGFENNVENLVSKNTAKIHLKKKQVKIFLGNCEKNRVHTMQKSAKLTQSKKPHKKITKICENTETYCTIRYLWCKKTRKIVNTVA